MMLTPLPLRFWRCEAILSVAADDTDRATKAISRRTSDARSLLARAGIDAAALARRLELATETVEAILADAVPPPAVMLDAEDAVAGGPDRRAAALAAAAALLGGDGWSPATLRLVRLPEAVAGAAAGLLDAAATTPPDALVLPKADDADAILAVRESVEASGDVRLVLLVETPRGVQAVAELVSAAGDRLAGVMFGAIDYAAAAGLRDAAEDHPLVAWARAAVVNAAAAAGVPAIDGMTVAYPVARAGQAAEEARAHVLGRLALVHDRAREAADLGMAGKLVGHPGQLVAVLLAFGAAFPAADVEAWESEAREFARGHADGPGVGLIGEAMVDAATDRHRRALLRRAAATGRWDPARAEELRIISRAEADDIITHGSQR